MITCPNCNTELADGTKFCSSCGTAIPEVAPVAEPVAEPVVAASVEAPVAAVEAPVAAVEAPVEAYVEPSVEAPAKKKFPIPKKAMIFGGIGVAAIAVLVLVLVLVLGGGKKGANNYALYLKDGEVYFNSLKKRSESVQLTSDLCGDSDASDEQLANEAYDLSWRVTMSKDGKYIFFPDKNDDNNLYTIYYKEVKNLDMKPVKVDSDIYHYYVNDASTIVTYLKNNNIYQYNIKADSKDKIVSDVNNYYVSDNGKKILYYNYDNDLYLYSNDDKEKLASNIDNLSYVSEDLNTVYYLKESKLYKQVVGKDKERIDSDVDSVLNVYDSGEIYYIKNNTETLSLMNYVVDDMKEADANVQYPTYPTYPDAPKYPTRSKYKTDAEYQTAYNTYKKAYADWEKVCDTIRDDYDDKVDAYYAKSDRDNLRQSLSNKTIERSVFTLYYYNGKEETVLSESFARNNYNYSTFTEKPLIAFEAYKETDIEKVKLSEVKYASDVSERVNEALNSSLDKYLAINGTATLLEQENISGFRFNKSGSALYYFDNPSEDGYYGDLYRIAIEDGKAGKAELYDKDVYKSTRYFTENDDVIYFKDYKENEGVLYINKNEVASDVYVYGIDYSDSDDIFYLTDWNQEKEQGTLNVYNGKESVEISEDVANITITPDDRVLYLYDYSMKSFEGELFEWNDGKIRKIDEDVTAIIPVFEFE